MDTRKSVATLVLSWRLDRPDCWREHNSRTSLSLEPAMILAQVSPIVINYRMCVNDFATTAFTLAMVHSR
jgi:hypothetical protein